MIRLGIATGIVLLLGTGWLGAQTLWPNQLGGCAGLCRGGGAPAGGTNFFLINAGGDKFLINAGADKYVRQ